MNVDNVDDGDNGLPSNPTNEEAHIGTSECRITSEADEQLSKTSSSEEHDHDKRTEERPISLAVAADTTQAPSMGAVASHLGSMLSHIPSSNNLVASLKSEIDNPDEDRTTHASNRSSSNNTSHHDIDKAANEAQRVDDDGAIQPLNNNDVQVEHKEHNFFKRIVHAIDNHFHPPSKLHLPHVNFARHHQGHRLDSIESGGQSIHACNGACLQPCQILLQQQQQTQQQSKKMAHGHPRRIPTFAPSLPFHRTNSHNSNNNNEQTHEPKQKSFFPFSFHSGPPKSPQIQHKPHFRGPLLYGTSDHDEHEAVITTALHVCNLYQAGEDVTRSVHRNNSSTISESEGEGCEQKVNNSEFDHRARHALSSLGFEFRFDMCDKCQEAGNNNDKAGGPERCLDCVTRLYHVPSNTAVTGDNRKTYIADGKMYDAVANLCQAVAQEIMAETCDLVWVTICDGKGGGIRTSQRLRNSQSKPRSNSVEEWPRDANGDIIIQQPIRALVARQAQTTEDTFLIATGKGKVRAGVFSRHHLLTTGLEPSTALPLIYEAQSRGMNCVIIDPNARGDQVGMDTFEVSIRGLFEQQSDSTEEEKEEEYDTDTSVASERRTIIPANTNGSIYVLAHSAAGGQLVRYLLDKQTGPALLSRIRCIAFTDSTHSVQWLKKHPDVSSLIQSSRALYVRSANKMRDDDWETVSPGDECPRDHFWSHRFGKIKTVWAGTTEHSLSNFTAHKPIWDHVDSIRSQIGRNSSSETDVIQSFSTIPQIMEKYETKFCGVDQSELYKPAGMVLPKLPMYHPYHPFKNVKGDDILQVPLAMILPNTDLVPPPLLKHIANIDVEGITPYFVAQTLPYDPETEVICRYQYALFPDAKSEMKGHDSIHSQSFIYDEQDTEEVTVVPATQIKIYESDKTKELSPTILCGNSMKLDNVERILQKNGMWSLVLGSESGTLGDDGLFNEISQAFVGFTYFLPDDDAYQQFLSLVRDKSPTEVLECVSELMQKSSKS